MNQDLKNQYPLTSAAEHQSTTIASHQSTIRLNTK